MELRPDLFAGVLPFVRTAEERSFGRAAASLGVTTAAVSKAIKKLEEDLGAKLLDRSSRVVTLTREGEQFLERCRPAVLHVLGAREALQGARREPRGELAVTLPFILAPFVVPHLTQLTAQYPRLKFRLRLSDRYARLADEQYDVAIRMGELESSSLVARRLRQTRWVTVASPTYLARSPAPRQVADLTDHNCLAFVGPNGKLRDWEFASGTFTPKGNLQIDHGGSLLDAARAALGVVQAMDFMVVDDLRTGALVEVLATAATRGPDIHALTTSGRATSASVRAFMRFLADCFA
jgi:DNA-binding transcriptional LysR family regulator